MPIQGLWNIGGLNLPDFGVSEFLGIGPRNAGFSQMSQWDLQGGYDAAQQAKQFSNQPQPPGAVLSSKTSPTRGPGPTPPPPSDNSGSPSMSTPNYDALINQINQNADIALSGLDPQRQAQEGIVGNTYNQGVSDLQAQQAQGNAALDVTRRKAGENQVKTLADLTENLRNMFQAGQTYLGARGAGDSSAANQYSYALTQMGNKNRGNVMSQTASIMNDINDRSNQLQMQVTQNIKQLDTEKQNALLGISQWFDSAQNQIRSAKGQNIVQLGQAALDNAMNAIREVNSQHQARYNSLLQWAENNATTIQGLKSNMQQLFVNYNPQLPVAGNLPGITAGPVGSNGQYYSQNLPNNNQRDWWNLR